MGIGTYAKAHSIPYKKGLLIKKMNISFTEHMSRQIKLVLLKRRII